MATEVIIRNHEMKFGANSVVTPPHFTPIPDAEHNPQIKALAIWAIDEHSKNSDDKLKLVKILFASQQESPKYTQYFMIFEASHLLLDLPNVLCEAMVLELGTSTQLIRPRKLLMFRIFGNLVENMG